MSTYGILIADTSWANQDNLEIDKATYLRHKDELIEGTQALIYLREPIDAIVAAAEITGAVLQIETLPFDPYFNPAIPANLHLERELDDIHSKTDPPPAPENNRETAKTYRVPLKVTRLKGQTPQIPLGRLQKTLGSDFTVFDETWIGLSKRQYQTIVAAWKKEQVS